MPIYKQYQLNSFSKLWVWHITEGEEELIKYVSLGLNCTNRLEAITHTNHRKGFLAVRSLLNFANISPDNLHYTDNGKPYLLNGPYISFSHTNDFAAIAVGKSPIGVDVERHRTKVKRVAQKFVNPKDQAPLDTIAALTDLWCVKESIYKAISIPGIRMSKDISVDLRIPDQGVATYKNDTYDIFRYVWNDHSCAVTLKNQL